jgi:hypothetical protein
MSLPLAQAKEAINSVGIRYSAQPARNCSMHQLAYFIFLCVSLRGVVRVAKFSIRNKSSFFNAKKQVGSFGLAFYPK